MTPADLGISPWWVMVGGAIPSIAGGLFVVWKLWYERGTEKVKGELTREERLMQDMDSRINLAAKIDAEVIARGVNEIASLIIKNKILEEDRNRGWNLARFWFAYLYDVWHTWSNKAIQADIMMRNAGLQPPMEWPDRAKIPLFEEPFPPPAKPDPPQS